MRVGSYNVLIPRDDSPGKAQDSWESRKASVVETIDSSFDLLGLQECSTAPHHRQSSYLVEELTARGWVGYLPWESKLFEDEFHERLPIFWRPELFELISSGQLLLSSWTEEELLSVPTLENRYASFVELRSRTCGSKLWFYTLHLQHQTATASEIEATLTELKREQSQTLLAEHMASAIARGETVVLGGDFNSPRVSGSLSSLANICSKADIVENWHLDSFHDWIHPENSEHIDHVLFAGPGRVRNASIVLSNASDHHPVRAILELAA